MALLDRLFRPRSIAVLGASATRNNNGNVVVGNLRRVAFPGTVIPIHPQAADIEDFKTVPAITDLPDGVDCAVISVPAAGVLEALHALEARNTATAIIMSSGFSAAQETALRDFMATSRILVQGPNCMGTLNITDNIPMYTAIPTPRLTPGRAAVIAQSGSAAIAVMNSTDLGFSKVITSGSQFRLDATDYLEWLAQDDATAVIGLVIETVPEVDRFADAIDRVHAAGKAVVVLKVGQSSLGAAATQAHTGALITSRDATAAYFRRYGVPTVSDYDELIAAMETFAVTRARPVGGNRIGIAGISGGEAALTCDLADQMGIPLAEFAPATVAALRELLPGTPGLNPIDFGASVAVVGTRKENESLDVIAADPQVDTVFVLQDAQFSLGSRSVRRYVGQVQNVVELGARTKKPVVIVSSSGETRHKELEAVRAGSDIPILRGLRPALAAMGCTGTWAARQPDPRRRRDRTLTPARAALRDAIANHTGPLPGPLTTQLLTEYGLPVVRSAVATDAADAAAKAASVGYPMVVKVISRDVPHRSDVGAVQLGIDSPASLDTAIATIIRNVAAAKPGAVIEGFELQEELTGWVEAVAGFKATPPYDALCVVGSGGTLVELLDDRALSLCPVTQAEATTLITGTTLGRRLAGYRNLLPRTDLAPLATVLASLSDLAADLCGVLAECDLNPVLVQPGTGAVRVVDALFVAG